MPQWLSCSRHSRVFVTRSLWLASWVVEASPFQGSEGPTSDALKPESPASNRKVVRGASAGSLGLWSASARNGCRRLGHRPSLRLRSVCISNGCGSLGGFNGPRHLPHYACLDVVDVTRHPRAQTRFRYSSARLSNCAVGRAAFLLLSSGSISTRASLRAINSWSMPRTVGSECFALRYSGVSGTAPPSRLSK